MKRSHCLAAILLAGLPCVAAADTFPPGHLDPVFGADGRRTVPVVLDVTAPNAIATVADPLGRLYSVGTFLSPQAYSIAITRLTQDGDVDTGFGTNGVVTRTVGTAPAIAHDAVFDPQGRLIVVGETSVNGVNNFFACRFNADGTADNTFGVANTPGCVRTFVGQGATAEAVVVQACAPAQQCVDDQRLVLAGAASLNGKSLGLLVALESDGTVIDSNFGVGGINFIPSNVISQPTRFFDVATNAAGELVAVGYVELANADRDFLAFRLDPDGVAESSFSGDGVRTASFDLDNVQKVDEAHAVHLFDDGSMLLAGQAQTGLLTHRAAILKLDAAGIGDGLFAGGGDGVPDGVGQVSYDVCGDTCEMQVRDLAVLPNGRILLAGSIAEGVAGDTNLDLARKSDMFALRLKPDGSPDASFRSDGSDVPGLATVPFDLVDGQSQDVASSLVLQADRVVLGGFAAAPDANDDGFEDYRFAFARLGNGGLIFADGFEE
ncbi:hypothetical protein [Chiayiivirga flava]|uniref:Putative delta-60 repeat protein n=1 Tax=Chiayiivirga flava TaxID=659595 RepID=A0A7W8D9H1_9GAMM|nr:hypothetical protein [Chiayiivirga flava]MBB5209235.1 putative delta-60 repeat protein [Chiayiivirga flava]